MGGTVVIRVAYPDAEAYSPAMRLCFFPPGGGTIETGEGRFG